MKAIVSYFLKRNRLTLFLPLILFPVLSPFFFKSKDFFEQRENVTISIALPHPFSTFLLLLYVSIWYWTLSSYFNTLLEDNLKYNLKYYKSSLLISLAICLVTSTLSYIYAEVVFHSTLLLTFVMLVWLCLTVYSFYILWVTNKIVRIALKKTDSNSFDMLTDIFQTAFLPFYLWKLQPQIQKNIQIPAMFDSGSLLLPH